MSLAAHGESFQIIIDRRLVDIGGQTEIRFIAGNKRRYIRALDIVERRQMEEMQDMRLNII